MLELLKRVSVLGRVDLRSERGDQYVRSGRGEVSAYSEHHAGWAVAGLSTVEPVWLGLKAYQSAKFRGIYTRTHVGDLILASREVRSLSGGNGNAGRTSQYYGAKV